MSEEIEHNPRRFLRLVETDDVVDVFLAMYTNGRVTGDKVGPHRDLVDEFPISGTSARSVKVSDGPTNGGKTS